MWRQELRGGRSSEIVLVSRKANRTRTRTRTRDEDDRENETFRAPQSFERAPHPITPSKAKKNFRYCRLHFPPRFGAVSSWPRRKEASNAPAGNARLHGESEIVISAIVIRHSGFVIMGAAPRRALTANPHPGAPYRSHSPITKSSEPRMATTSLIMWPGKILGRMLRFTKEGLRIFSRCGVPPPLE